MDKFSFNDLPAAVFELNRKLDVLLAQSRRPLPEPDRLLTIEELINYLPEHPAKQTIYQWTNDRKIPYEKFSKRLFFRQSAIEKWLQNGRRTL